ncbi:hypothetical protein NPIL_669021 [Nephila pilipes]|uniref:Uncharacterized protein n=1 Tax=Nephila pilipes TaxID=299642 RepID=A0A8X6K960_NEPPI|nr:hypothetical protein NPIL_669021 [Nephila pilipes]
MDNQHFRKGVTNSPLLKVIPIRQNLPIPGDVVQELVKFGEILWCELMATLRGRLRALLRRLVKRGSARKPGAEENPSVHQPASPLRSASV